MPFALQARDVRKSFGGVEVLHGVDLDATGGSILALLGENGAGKSTLVKIIAGDYLPDGGTIDVDGTTVASLSPRQARELGVAIIFQEFQDAPTLTVAENISLGRLPNRAGIVDWRAVRKRADKILGELDVDIDPDRQVSSLRVGERQIVEIARALSGSARLLILDEPTAALSHHEAEVLFAFVRRLRDQGVAIIYITHRLDEVFRIADQVQVLRDGHVALVADVKATTRRDMIEAMIGRRLADIGRPEAPTTPHTDVPVVRWRDANVAGEFEDVSLDVHVGEVVALYGKLGSGAAEVAETAYGLRPLTSGAVEIEGVPRQFSAPHHAIEGGVGFLPAERKGGRRVHGAAGRRERGHRVVATHGPLPAAHRQRPSSARIPALARPAVDPIPERPAAAHGHALGRQPAEGAAREVAGAPVEGARAHRADARRGRRRAPRHLQRAP
jgi:ribose transport system ATP-binding protein